MALWGRLGGNSDDDARGNVPYELFDAVLELWITGPAAGGITGAQAAAALSLDAAETAEAQKLRAALLALPNDNQRRLAAAHLRALWNLHEFDRPPFNTAAAIRQSLVAWFAAKGVTF